MADPSSHPPQVRQPSGRPTSNASGVNPSEPESSHQTAWKPTDDYTVIRQAEVNGTAPTLVGFPFSGSGSAMFASWREHLPPQFSLIAATLPAREHRLDEPAWSSIEQAADQLADSLVTSLPTSSTSRECEIIPVGFSIGALLAFEVTKRIVDRGIRVPLLVVASRISPTIETPPIGFAEMDDRQFVDVLSKQFGAIPPDIAANQELLELLLPALRGDLEMGETYHHGPGDPLPCDVLAAHGGEDESVRLQWISGWEEVGQNFRGRTFAGGHFFVREQTKAFLDTIVTRYQASPMSSFS